jgi:hypothetical protein
MQCCLWKSVQKEEWIEKDRTIILTRHETFGLNSKQGNIFLILVWNIKRSQTKTWTNFIRFGSIAEPKPIKDVTCLKIIVANAKERVKKENINPINFTSSRTTLIWYIKWQKQDSYPIDD